MITCENYFYLPQIDNTLENIKFKTYSILLDALVYQRPQACG